MMVLATQKNSFRSTTWSLRLWGGDDRVKATYLLTTLSDTARSWLINLPEGTVHSWDPLCAMFISHFQGTYERPSTAETLKTVK
jgi:hypothetical protein